MWTQTSTPSATDALSEVHKDTNEQRNNNKQSRTEKTTLKNNKKHKTDKSTANIKLNTLKDHKITPNVQRTTQEVLKRHTTPYLCNNTQNDDPEM